MRCTTAPPLDPDEPVLVPGDPEQADRWPSAARTASRSRAASSRTSAASPARRACRSCSTTAIMKRLYGNLVIAAHLRGHSAVRPFSPRPRSRRSATRRVRRIVAHAARDGAVLPRAVRARGDRPATDPRRRRSRSRCRSSTATPSGASPRASSPSHSRGRGALALLTSGSTGTPARGPPRPPFAPREHRLRRARARARHRALRRVVPPARAVHRLRDLELPEGARLLRRARA